MRLPILRAPILGFILAATPASLSGSGFLSTSHDHIVLARSDVLACDPPYHLPGDVKDAYLRVRAEPGTARLWRTDIYDLSDCLRTTAEVES